MALKMVHLILLAVLLPLVIIPSPESSFVSGAGLPSRALIKEAREIISKLRNIKVFTQKVFSRQVFKFVVKSPHAIVRACNIPSLGGTRVCRFLVCVKDEGPRRGYEATIDYCREDTHAPTPAPSPAPTPAQRGDTHASTPAPSPAPTPAQRGDTHAPTPAPSPAPTPAQRGDTHAPTPAPSPAPTPAQRGDTHAPTPAPSPAPTPAQRGIAATDGAPVPSTRSFSGRAAEAAGDCAAPLVTVVLAFVFCFNLMA